MMIVRFSLSRLEFTPVGIFGFFLEHSKGHIKEQNTSIELRKGGAPQTFAAFIDTTALH